MRTHRTIISAIILAVATVVWKNSDGVYWSATCNNDSQYGLTFDFVDDSSTISGGEINFSGAAWKETDVPFDLFKTINHKTQLK